MAITDVLKLLILSIAIGVGVDAQCPTKLNRTSSLNSDGRVVIQWQIDNENITMKVTGKSKGWVGLGFSPKGGMTGADIVMGWVKDGKPYLLDLYATHNGRPFLDKIQSYQLLEASENDTHTTICWTRKLDTCDEQDLPITSNTNSLIWAFNNEDPVNATSEGPEYHGENRGTKSERLINQIYPRLPDKYLKTFDVLSINLTIPSNTTTIYWCSISQVSKRKKHRLVGYEPKFQSGGKNYLHHLVIYQCPGKGYDDLYKELPSKGFACNSHQMSKYRMPCLNAVVTWSLGAEGEFFPPYVGFPFGSPDENNYYMLEAHYNIMNKDDVGKRDSSGVTFYVTDKPIKYDSGILVVGYNVTPWQIIPARQTNFSTIALCQPECLKQKLPSEGINIFSIFFHAHMAGRKIRLHIFRNGTELKPLADEHYDFEYQQPIVYEKEIKIYPDDVLMAECIYDTSDRNNTTAGYFGSTDEMCLIYLNYYPLMNITWCSSFLAHPKLLKLIGVEDYTQAINQVNITKPEKFANQTLNDYLHQLEFSDSQAAELQQMYFELPQITECLDLEGLEIKREKNFTYPSKIQRKDVDESNCKATE